VPVRVGRGASKGLYGSRSGNIVSNSICIFLYIHVYVALLSEILYGNTCSSDFRATTVVVNLY
jgi:hypothetical protein